MRVAAAIEADGGGVARVRGGGDELPLAGEERRDDGAEGCEVVEVIAPGEEGDFGGFDPQIGQIGQLQGAEGVAIENDGCERGLGALGVFGEELVVARR